MTKHIPFKHLCLALALVAAGLNVRAQQLEFSGYFNGFFPVGEFNNRVDVTPYGQFTPINRDNVACAASPGIGASLRAGLWLDVGANHWLLPFAEVSFLWNSTSASIRKIYDNNDFNSQIRSIPRVPEYFNIPLQIGLKYRYDITDIIHPFAEVGIGFDLMVILPNGYSGVSYDDPNYGIIDNYRHYTYRPSGSLTWSLGAGTYLGRNVTLGLYYIDLGQHRLEYGSRSYSDDTTPSYFTSSRSLGEVALRVGFHF